MLRIETAICKLARGGHLGNQYPNHCMRASSDELRCVVCEDHSPSLFAAGPPHCCADGEVPSTPSQEAAGWFECDNRHAKVDHESLVLERSASAAS